MSLTDGRGGLRLAEEALATGQAALHDETTQYTGFNLLEVIRLSTNFGLKEADVGLIPSLLLRGERGDQKKMKLEL